jgi:hypothetical protein
MTRYVNCTSESLCRLGFFLSNLLFAYPGPFLADLICFSQNAREPNLRVYRTLGR